MIKKLSLIPTLLTLFMLMITPSNAATFQPNDRWCAAGDSITHGGTYHKFILLYYATRFPDYNVRLYNCGISGDTAGGLLKRLDWDVLSKNPTVVSIMLGMNDVGIYDYGADKNTPAHEQIRQRNLDAYKRSMKELAERLRSAGVRMIFITPSIYDDTSEIDTSAFKGGNDGLGACAQYVRQLAVEYNAQLVDFYLPMKKINLEQQKIDPKFTLIGPDRVHPGDIGHFVMAYLFLKDQGAPKHVSYIGIDAIKGEADKELNCKVTNIKARKNSISFCCIENALPFPIQDSVKPALDLVPFTNNLNQETLRIGGLSDGTYVLKIDGLEIGRYTAATLASGINLAVLANTPQYQQALKVMEANEKRHSIVTNSLRNIAAVEYLYWPDRSKGPVTLEQIRPIIDKIKDANKNTPTSYIADFIEVYERDKPHEAELNRQAEKYLDQMYKLAQPHPHQFVLAKQD